MISIQNSIHLCPDKIVGKGAEKLLFSKFLVQYIRSTCMQVNFVTGKFTDFPVCVIRNIFIRKLSHLTISSPFILINQKMHKKKTTVAFE